MDQRPTRIALAPMRPFRCATFRSGLAVAVIVVAAGVLPLDGDGVLGQGRSDIAVGIAFAAAVGIGG